jgi:hypothetical protein
MMVINAAAVRVHRARTSGFDAAHNQPRMRTYVRGYVADRAQLEPMRGAQHNLWKEMMSGRGLAADGVRAGRADDQ